MNLYKRSYDGANYKYHPQEVKDMKRILVCILLLMALGLCVSQPVYADGAAPAAENLEINTFRNATVTGQLTAHDPQGGKLKFVLTTEPVKGSLELNEDGSFVYTPNEGKRGRDYFGYKVSDGEGNLSQEATVIIRIQKPDCDVYYSDMDGRAEEYCAMLLNEKGIFTGSCTAGEYRFEPERAVSRGELERICRAFGVEGVKTEIGADAELITARDAAVVLDEMNCHAAQTAPELMSCAAWNTSLTPDYLTRAQLAYMICDAMAFAEK